ncbi:MAG TPA: deoxyribose-phosphate aldolase [Bacteroidales bacterium]|nr:deoxyribose-phosphate aldolase [Bacteroidales bacterium]
MSNTFHGKSKKDIKNLISRPQSDINPVNPRRIIGLLDFTSLNVTDNSSTIEKICEKVNNYSFVFPDLPAFAGICVYPRLVHVVKKNLEDPTIKIASVAGGFPSSQTTTAVKTLEVREALDAGADEIDMVMPVGEFLRGNKNYIKDEIAEIKNIMADKHLKIIIESGVLSEPEMIFDASMLAIESGADFIKTSSGKEKESASPEDVYIMCHAIRDFYHDRGIMVGIKPAGGISTYKDAVIYYSIIEMILGKEWLLPENFRIGASSLANSLLSEVEGRNVDYF